MSENKKPINERVIDHMQAKYGDEFIKTFSILGVGGQSPFDEFTDVKGISERHPERVITIRVYPPDYFSKYPEYEKKELILDDYIGICRANEIAKVYEKDIVGVYDKYKIMIKGITGYLNVLPLEINMETSVEDIVKNSDVRGVINIFVEDEITEKDEKVKKVIDIFLLKYDLMIINVVYVKELSNPKTAYYRMSQVISKENNSYTFKWKIRTKENDNMWKY